MAGRISKETITQIHNQTDIVALVGESTKLERKSGNDFWGCCPFHNEKTPSFHVDGDKKMYYCFSCHKSGNAVGFVMETQGLNYVETLHFLAKRSGIAIQYDSGPYNSEEYKYDDTKDKIIELYERVCNMFHYFLTETQEGKEALEYLLKRGLTLETIKKFKLGYAPKNIKWLKNFLRSKNFSDEFLEKTRLFSKNYPDISFFNDRIMFPIFDRHGQTVAFSGRILHPSNNPSEDRKYMNTPEMVQYKKRETLYAFNFAKNAIRLSKSIIFCEGNMDVIAYHQAGIENAVATCGTALTEDHLKVVQGLCDTIILAFDSDNAGMAATEKSIILCRRMNFTVKVLHLRGGKDASEILQNFGKENLTNQVASSILDSDYLLNRLGQLYPLDTPEGKSKAAFSYFKYIDSLQSYSHKESSLDLLCQTLNLSPEAVRRDFQNNRNQSPDKKITPQTRQTNNQTEQKAPIQMNAELRGILAVVCNLQNFQQVRQEITADDLENPSARELFNILEECYQENSLSMPLILDKMQANPLISVVTSAVSSKAYDNTEENGKKGQALVQDFIKLVKKNALEKRISVIQCEIKSFIPITEEDKQNLNALVSEKIKLELQARNM